MPIAHETLKIEFNKCPPDCRLCEEACAKEKGKGILNLSRIKPVHAPEVDFHGALTCIQCGRPKCLEICPVGAIAKNPDSGVATIDDSRCVGCGLCTLACPYGAIYYDSQKQQSFKCDLCGGEPKCVQACPYHLITHVKNQPLLELLHEDVMVSGTSACRGCPAELAMRFTLRILGKDTVIFTAPGCAIAFVMGFDNKASALIPQYTCLLDNTAASMTGVYRYFRSIGKKTKVVSFVGDGATVDIGFQALSGAAERGENIIYICYDNEGYMNTGVQRSGSTPYGARTYTSPVGKETHGKEQTGKNLPLLMLFHGIPYVATASISHPEDYARKLIKAMKVKDGLVYIHLFSPCNTGWGIPEDQGIEVSRVAVETNYFPLWEAEHGKVRLTHDVADPKPIKDYTSLMSKYSHLNEKDIEKIQQIVNDRYNLIKGLATSGILCRA